MGHLFKLGLHFVYTSFEIHCIDKITFGMNYRDTSLKGDIVRKIWNNSCPPDSSNYSHQQIIFLNIGSFILLLELKVCQVSWLIKIDDVIMYILRR